MYELPPAALLDEARALANHKGHSVYLYLVEAAWYMHESLGAIPSDALILEIKPHATDGETDNTGGC
ncbi:hypothetical protein J2T55_001887 [Methylohalomonas lacus]|uniref:Uncharacterized protein n=1 Tax=Methylohalomonas lacus TaxID=398773 RepID=A0AAE3HK61_9GAMM|nr:hypothetical protein [Methylohalomonas lacus]MCS3903855.1 hypothetical protein [Methylohalomonas lacus]